MNILDIRNLLVFVVYRFYVIKLSQRKRKAYKINSEAFIFDQIYVINHFTIWKDKQYRTLIQIRVLMPKQESMKTI